MDWLEEAIKRQATPKHARLDSTEEFCAKFGIDVKQYYYQLSKEENKKKILEIVLNKAKDSAPEVLDKLVEKAIAGDMRAMDIYVDSILQLAKNLDIKTGGRPIIRLAEEIVKKNEINLSPSDDS